MKAPFELMDKKEQVEFFFIHDKTAFRNAKTDNKPLSRKKICLQRFYSLKWIMKIIINKIDSGYYNYPKTEDNERTGYREWLVQKIDFINQTFMPHFDAINCANHVEAIEAMTEDEVDSITFI